MTPSGEDAPAADPGGARSPAGVASQATAAAIAAGVVVGLVRGVSTIVAVRAPDLTTAVLCLAAGAVAAVAVAYALAGQRHAALALDPALGVAGAVAGLVAWGALLPVVAGQAVGALVGALVGDLAVGDLEATLVLDDLDPVRTLPVVAVLGLVAALVVLGSERRSDAGPLAAGAYAAVPFVLVVTAGGLTAALGGAALTSTFALGVRGIYSWSEVALTALALVVTGALAGGVTRLVGRSR